MAAFEDHCRECKQKLGDRYEEVNRRIDQFAHYPDMEFLSRHRQFLHHEEGIEYFRMSLGEKAGEAAKLHVLRDCGHIPRAMDYHIGVVDCFGREIGVIDLDLGPGVK